MLYTYEDNEQPLIFWIAICLNFNCYFCSINFGVFDNITFVN